MKKPETWISQWVGGLNITLTYEKKQDAWDFVLGLCCIRTRYVSFPKGRLVNFFLSMKECFFLRN